MIYSGELVWSMVTLGVGAVLIILWVAARRGELTPKNPEKRLRKVRGTGRPTVVYLYSDFNLGCLAARPFLLKADREARRQAETLYLNTNRADVRQLAAQLGAGTGTFILIDGSGAIRDRVRTLTAERMAELLEAPAH